MAQRVSRYVQYLYFMRFSIILWLLLPILAVLDWAGFTTSFTRGIFALESWQQVSWAAFFVVATNMVVLITARVVCINGHDRFGVEPPSSLARLFGNQSHNRTWCALVLTQVSGALVLAYVGKASVEERGVEWPSFMVFALVGIFFAILFWYINSLFYYWTYSGLAYEGKDGVQRTTKSAMPLIFPPDWFGDLEAANPPWFARMLTCLRLRSRLSYPGYAPSRGAQMWELHYFSTVALWGFVVLYLCLVPINAPVTLWWGMGFLFVVAVVPSAALLAGTILSESNPAEKPSRLVATAKAVFIIVPVGIIVSWFVCLLANNPPREERGMPTLASVLVLSMMLTWLLAALAFFFDRYRVPVLLIALVLVIIPKLFPGTHSEEHYFCAIPQTVASATVAPAPAQVLDLRRREQKPLVIVTATGGGIHAAGWTAEILADLEKEFASNAVLQQQNYSLHDHVLLASGVSGGSVGLATYLREYTAQHPFYSMNDVRRRMTGAANCSSLEAVAWGLGYYDFANFLLSFLPLPATGSDFVDGQPVGYDRSWALERTFERNQSDKHCETKDRPEVPGLETAGSMTLSRSVDLLLDGKMPAFTLNTTVAETGDRFLLANYQVLTKNDPHSDVLPAESFLHVFGQPGSDGSSSLHHKYADLSLATAARLSATFPYVSSASRIPRAFADYSFHFVDGGYFDNDGTSSVIEFLRDALSERQAPAAAQKCQNPTAQNEKKRPLPILLIEIRDSWDLNAASNDDSFSRQDPPPDQSKVHPWRAIQQLGAPPKALWLAGHTSVTRRNRRELCLLEKAYQDEITIHHIVFDYENPQGEYQPLNWHLTKNQMQLIREQVTSKDKDAIRKKLAAAANWTQKVLVSGLDQQDLCSVCETADPN